ncbi:hypothetical protein CRG98_024185 [Punica granatum]|uniref:Uncharacterized protein n=1 Tax=Punica granatum TaxID=22663 RepID=A0A2I0JGN8_PUNGR|nr:hypothetical protein CRG98_024185 [Punica granatum]
MDVEEVWTCMGMHANKPKGRSSMVGGHTNARMACTGARQARGGRAAGARQARGACAGARESARLALDWHYSPESDDFSRNALNDLKQ